MWPLLGIRKPPSIIFEHATEGQRPVIYKINNICVSIYNVVLFPNRMMKNYFRDPNILNRYLYIVLYFIYVGVNLR